MSNLNYKGDAPQSVDVLDHGFVALRNLSGPTRRVWGAEELFDGIENEGPYGIRKERTFDADDTDPANSARMSFGQMNTGRTHAEDMKLADYLLRNRHMTPFEMIEVWIEMKMPIFVARQFVRHRTAGINEISGRYVELPAEWYVPEVANIGFKAENKKQGRAMCEPGREQEWFARTLNQQCALSYDLYKESLDMGIAPEVARSFLHVNHYTHWLWKQDLRNLMGFLSLRDHSHAQWESQQYAKSIDGMLRQHLPETMGIYDKYIRQE